MNRGIGTIILFGVLCITAEKWVERKFLTKTFFDLFRFPQKSDFGLVFFPPQLGFFKNLIMIYYLETELLQYFF